MRVLECGEVFPLNDASVDAVKFLTGLTCDLNVWAHVCMKGCTRAVYRLVL